MSAGVFQFGPAGRAVNVDASGALMAVEGGDQSSYQVFGFGQEGRPLAVTPSGELHVNMSAPFSEIDSPGASGAMDLSSQRTFDIILDKNVVFTDFGEPRNGARYLFVLENTGNKTVTWPSNVKWRGATEPTLSTASGAIDVVTMVYRARDDTFLADIGTNFDFPA